LTKKKIFLIGGNGFVGKSFQTNFNEKYSFTIYDQSDDILNYKNLHSALRSSAPDFVVNLASFSTISESRLFEERIYNINVIGNKYVCDVLDKINFVGTYLFVSSAEVYGYSQDIIFRESDAPNPQNEYAVAKLMSENLLKFKSTSSKYKIRIARSFNHFGEHQTGNFLIPKIAQEIANSKDKENIIIAIGNLTAKRSYLHVDDICYAYSQILEHASSVFEIFNVCHNNSFSIPELFAQASKELGMHLKFLQAKEAFADNSLMGSNEKLLAINWYVRCNLTQAIINTINTKVN
jgi:GDP-4-dehydro-6-deoxy-D-mannose reductase